MNLNAVCIIIFLATPKRLKSSQTGQSTASTSARAEILRGKIRKEMVEDILGEEKRKVDRANLKVSGNENEKTIENANQN